jgi:hypothetical protein
MELEMCIRPRVKYKSKLIIGMHKCAKLCRNKWLLMKNYKSFWKRPREFNLLIMMVFSWRIMSIRSRLLYFK